MRATHRGRILLVDDDDVVRRALGSGLSAHHAVVEAPSLPQALEILETSERPFDAVIIDPDFPEGPLRDRAAVLHLTNHSPDLAVIVTTRRRETGAVEGFMLAGAADYVEKNEDGLATLLFRLGHHLERVRLRRENAGLTAQMERLFMDASCRNGPPSRAPDPPSTGAGPQGIARRG